MSDVLLQPIVDRDSVKKLRGYDEKVIRVKQEWLTQRDPWLSLTCGKGHELQNYRCRQYSFFTCPLHVLVRKGPPLVGCVVQR